MCRLAIIFFAYLIYSGLLYGQTDTSIRQLDSLKYFTYDDLSVKFYNSEIDSSTAAIYANTYLTRAKEDGDTIKMADGYFFMTRISKGSIAINYADSIIAITKNIENNKHYPFFGYYTRAGFFFDKRKFKRALDDYLQSYKHLNELKGTVMEYILKHNIGLLKSRVGEYEEALVLFRECVNFYLENDNKNEYNLNYLVTLIGLSDTYMRNQLLDSASMYNRIGYKESMLVNNKKELGYFILNEGVNLFFKKDYNVAIDSITNALPVIKEIEDKPNLAFAYFYLGKSHLELQDKEKAIMYLKKVDTIFQEISDIHPEMRESYEILINHYKRVEDKEQQLLYTERLLTVDSILHDNYKYISKNIIRRYDTPQLLSEKDELIAALDSKWSKMTIGIIGAAILVTGLFFYYDRKQRVYKKRLEKLLEEKKTQEDEDKAAKGKIKNTEIPKDIMMSILKGLEQFEIDKGYLAQNLNLKDLARDLQTNTKYLSKTINLYKQKSFNNYVNDLRVDYAVSRLKTDRKFRNYTIKAIARDTGFNSPEPFSKTFYKRTGIYPSFLIKELNKNL